MKQKILSYLPDKGDWSKKEIVSISLYLLFTVFVSGTVFWSIEDTQRGAIRRESLNRFLLFLFSLLPLLNFNNPSFGAIYWRLILTYFFTAILFLIAGSYLLWQWILSSLVLFSVWECGVAFIRVLKTRINSSSLIAFITGFIWIIMIVLSGSVQHEFDMPYFTYPLLYTNPLFHAYQSLLIIDFRLPTRDFHCGDDEQCNYLSGVDFFNSSPWLLLVFWFTSAIVYISSFILIVKTPSINLSKIKSSFFTFFKNDYNDYDEQLPTTDTVVNFFKRDSKGQMIAVVGDIEKLTGKGVSRCEGDLPKFTEYENVREIVRFAAVTRKTVMYKEWFKFWEHVNTLKFADQVTKRLNLDNHRWGSKKLNLSDKRKVQIATEIVGCPQLLYINKDIIDDIEKEQLPYVINLLTDFVNSGRSVIVQLSNENSLFEEYVKKPEEINIQLELWRWPKGVGPHHQIRLLIWRSLKGLWRKPQYELLTFLYYFLTSIFVGLVHFQINDITPFIFSTILVSIVGAWIQTFYNVKTVINFDEDRILSPISSLHYILWHMPLFIASSGCYTLITWGLVGYEHMPYFFAIILLTVLVTSYFNKLCNILTKSTYWSCLLFLLFSVIGVLMAGYYVDRETMRYTVPWCGPFNQISPYTSTYESLMVKEYDHYKTGSDELKTRGMVHEAVWKGPLTLFAELIVVIYLCFVTMITFKK